LAHLRKQIWDNIVTALTGLSTTGSRVYERGSTSKREARQGERDNESET